MKQDQAKVSEINGGSNAELLNTVIQKGYCLEDHLPSKNGGDSINESIIEIENLSESYRKLQVFDAPCETTMRANSLVKTLKDSKTEELILILNQATPLKTFEVLADKACTPRPTLPKGSKTVISAGEPKLNAIDWLMDQDKPALVSVNANGFLAPEFQQQKNPAHSLVVMARQINPTTQTCEYYLRNSWNGSCNGISSKFECDSENGGFWASSGQLKKMLNTTEYLDP